MAGIKNFALAFIIWQFQLSTIYCDCQIETGNSGTLSDSTLSSTHSKCWFIQVPKGRFVNLKIIEFFSERFCHHNYLNVSIRETGEEYQFCSEDQKKIPAITALHNVIATHYVNSDNTDNWISRTTLEFKIQDLECLNKDSYRCDNHSCIPQSKVCNGVKDCRNGADEEGCVLAITGIEEARKKAISWLINRRTSSWGWKENTPRAIVALYLGSYANFNGLNLEEELMAKEAELRIAAVCPKDSLTTGELSVHINALLVTCRNPRKFFGDNLVERLKKRVETSENYTHPLSYLALCNANEKLDSKAISDLNEVLDNRKPYPFIRDLQAVAVMAISCLKNQKENVRLSILSNSSELISYEDTLKRFKKLQNQDGSFGNVYTTALTTQALLSSGQELSKDWNLSAAVHYLIEKLCSSSADFLSTYLTLPILNGKSLADISKRSCLCKPEEDPDRIIINNKRPKMKIQYTLYIGDEEEVTHSISLQVPENSTAAEVMKFAEMEDPKYTYKWKNMHVFDKGDEEDMYVYEIANVKNDPEAGKFWHMYIDYGRSGGQIFTSPDRFVMHSGEGLIMWYQTTSLWWYPSVGI